MTPAANRDPSALCEEIRAEGRRRAEALREGARAEGEASLAAAAAAVEEARHGAEEAARREGARRRERALAGVPIELARLRAARVEAVLEAVRERARRELGARRGPDDREAVVTLAAEALARMDGEAFVLGLAPGDRARLGPGLEEEIRRRAGRPGVELVLADDRSIAGGGLILRDREGRQVWDDRLEVRLDRLWPALRPPVAIALGLLAGPGGAP